MLRAKTKLLLYYLLELALIGGLMMPIYLRRFVLAWPIFFFLLALALTLSRYYFHPFPKAHRNAHSHLLFKVFVVLLVIFALGVGAANIIACYATLGGVERINLCGFLFLFVFLVMMGVLCIREEIRAANKADEEKANPIAHTERG